MIAASYTSAATATAGRSAPGGLILSSTAFRRVSYVSEKIFTPPQPRSCLAKPVGSIDKGDEHVELHYRHAPLSQSAHLRLLNGPVCDSGVAVAVMFESSQLFVLIVQRAAKLKISINKD